MSLGIKYQQIAAFAAGIDLSIFETQKGDFHPLGEVPIFSFEPAIEQVVSAFRSDMKQVFNEHIGERQEFLDFDEYVHVVSDYDKLRAAKKRDLRDNATYGDNFEITLKSGNVVRAEEFIYRYYDRRRHTPDGKGYVSYLKVCAPELAKVLQYPIPIYLPEHARRLGTYLVAEPKGGKSTLMKVMLRSYIAQNIPCSIVLIDPHSAMIPDMLNWPEWGQGNNRDRLVLIDTGLSSTETPCINPLEVPAGTDPDNYAQALLGVFGDMLGTDFTINMENLLLNCLQLLLEASSKGELVTLRDLQDVLRQPENKNRWWQRASKHPDEDLRSFFAYEFGQERYHPTKQALVARLRKLLSMKRVKSMFVGKSTIDLSKLLQEQKIILLKLSSEDVGEMGQQAIGLFVMGILHQLAQKRQAENFGVPWHLFIDEVQLVQGKVISQIISEDRKRGLIPTMAHQRFNQIKDKDVKASMLNGTDVKFFGRRFSDNATAKTYGFDVQDCLDLKAGEFFIKWEDTKTLQLQVPGGFTIQVQHRFR